MIYFYSTIVQLKMYRILRTLAGCAIVACLALAVHAEPSLNPSTFCNPLNLNYPFVYSQSHRETGEPTPILYKGDYYLFASWLRGYWWSTSLSNDFSTWTFVPHTPIRLNAYHQ